MVLQTPAGAAGGSHAVLILAAAGSEGAGVTDAGHEQVLVTSTQGACMQRACTLHGNAFPPWGDSCARTGTAYPPMNEAWLLLHRTPSACPKDGATRHN